MFETICLNFVVRLLEEKLNFCYNKATVLDNCFGKKQQFLKQVDLEKPESNRLKTIL